LTVESPIIPQFYQAKLKPVIEQFSNYASALFTTMPEEITVPRAHIHPLSAPSWSAWLRLHRLPNLHMPRCAKLDQFDSALHRNVQSQHSCQVGCICDAAAVVSLPTAAQLPKTRLDTQATPTQGHLQENDAGL